MLVCPQCQFDNPNTHQYCQKCGTSLAHTNCPECGEKVSFGEESCPHCGTFTGAIWWAIMAEHHPQSFPSQASPEFTRTSEQYLDPGRRYRLTALSETDSANGCHHLQGKVIDCQPLQKSVLKVLLAEKTGWLMSEGEPLKSLKDLKPSPWIPQLAFPYLALQEFYPAIPEIHEAWQEESKEVVLLPDRSDWQLLKDLLIQETLPTLQIVYWLDEMAKLWKILCEVNCRQSLLVINNLRVDEDQTFGLQQLYADSPHTELTLCHLGQMWQALLQPSKAHQTDSLLQLLQQVAKGEIITITELRLQLQELADEQQLLLLANNPENDDLSNILPNELLLSDFKTSTTDENFDTGPSEQTIIDSVEGDDLSTAVIPMQLLSLTDTGCTDNGRQRRHNEDSFGMITQVKKQQSNRGQRLQVRGLYLVCDGMGGHAAGEVASALAVETLQRYFATTWRDELPTKEVIKQGILLANQTIYQINQEKESYGSGRMGTTLVMALIHDTQVAIAHVGDSRIYRLSRKWGLDQLTVDHEVGQRAIQEGIEPKIAYSRPDAYQLTQALGPHDNHYVKPDIQFFEVQEDTLLLLCSDGLSDNELIENQWQNNLSPLLSSRMDLEEGLQKLMALGNQKNGHDNITAILVRIKVQPSLEQSIWF